jgi:hypothetical protein
MATKSKTKSKTKKITPFVLKNLNSKDFKALLVRNGACTTAMDWAEGKSLKQVWRTCNRPNWLQWLLRRMTNTTARYPEQFIVTRKESLAWGGIGRFTAANRHYSKVYHSQADTWDDETERQKFRKEQADVFRAHYVVE